MKSTKSTEISGALIDVWFEVDGQRVPIYLAKGTYWIEAQIGKNYAIVVRNHTERRLEILESVDGRDVLEDQLADLRSVTGMVITGTWRNNGWLVSKTQTNDFVFADPFVSIAAQATGTTSNVGVIGVAVYQEKFQRRPEIIPFSYGTKGGLETLVRGETSDAGTGMGKARPTNVGSTTFERNTTYPFEVFQIQYRTRAWLVANDIIVEDMPLPNAFPGSDTTGYKKYTR